MQIIHMLDVKIVSAAKGFHSCEMRCSICQSLCMISERQGMIAYNPMHEAASQDKYRNPCTNLTMLNCCH